MRYQIWNKIDDIYTPSGEHFTAEQWVNRYPWAKIPGAKMIITTGVINGGAAMEFENTKAVYLQQGANITADMSDTEVLQAIEDFEDNPPGANEPSSEERIAAALEAQVMLAEPDADTPTVATYSLNARSAPVESPALARIKRNVKRGLWSKNMVAVAVRKGHITEDEYSQILEELHSVSA